QIDRLDIASLALIGGCAALCRLVTHPDCKANCARCDHTQRDPGRFCNLIPASIEESTGIDAPGSSTTSENGTASAFGPAIVRHAAWKGATSTVLERRSTV